MKGFDEVKLLVNINDQIVFYEDQISNYDLWKKGVIDLSIFDEDELTVSFFSGNYGDDQLSSWSMIENLTTYFILNENYQDIYIQDKNNNELLNINLSNLEDKVKIEATDMAGNSSSKEISLEKTTVYDTDLFEIKQSLEKLGFTF